MVALWQCVGFAHGVLNTDNMSIIGLTLDYGPFGFLDSYNPDFICNGSDHDGRYSFKNQPSICKWNLDSLADSLGLISSVTKLKVILNKFFDSTYEQIYLEKMLGTL